MRELTSQIPNKDLTRGHLIEVTHVHTIPGERLRVKYCRTRMNKDSSIFLVKIFDSLSFGIEFHSARNGGCEFLVGEIDACELGIEGAGDQRAKERYIGIILVEGYGDGGGGNEGEFAERD